MMISRNANRYFQPLDPDAELIKITNNNLRLLAEYELDDNLLLIKSQLYDARTAFLEACLNEVNDNLYDNTEKTKTRVHLESTIESFEKIREEICME